MANPMPSKVLCSQLTFMSQALQQAVRIISAEEIQTENAQNAKKVAMEYIQHARQDHKATLQRKQLIEARKEFIENQSKAKEHQEVTERLKKERQEREAEDRRLKKEAKEREEERVKKEMEDLKRRKIQDRLEALKKTAVGARALADITPEDLDEMDADDIMAKQLRQMEKERKDKETKLKAQEKKVDYFERAKRVVEVPLLQKQYQEQIKEDRRFHEEQEEERIAKDIAERKEAETTHARMSRMKQDKKEFLQHLKESRHVQYLEKLETFKSQLEEARVEQLEKRRQERKQKRKAEDAAAKRAEEEKLTKMKMEEERNSGKRRERRGMLSWSPRDRSSYRKSWKSRRRSKDVRKSNNGGWKKNEDMKLKKGRENKKRNEKESERESRKGGVLPQNQRTGVSLHERKSGMVHQGGGKENVEMSMNTTHQAGDHIAHQFCENERGSEMGGDLKTTGGLGRNLNVVVHLQGEGIMMTMVLVEEGGRGMTGEGHPQKESLRIGGVLRETGAEIDSETGTRSVRQAEIDSETGTRRETGTEIDSETGTRSVRQAEIDSETGTRSVRQAEIDTETGRDRYRDRDQERETG